MFVYLFHYLNIFKYKIDMIKKIKFNNNYNYIHK